MKTHLYIIISLLLWGSACQPSNKEEKNASTHYQLVKTDSFRIDYMGMIIAIDYYKDRFALYDASKNNIILADVKGTVLSKKQFPKEGPGSLRQIMNLRIAENGELLLHGLSGDLIILNQKLEIINQPKPPITYMLRSMRYNSQMINRWGDYIIDFYPGRDDVSPYTQHYFVNNHLMEKINIHTQEAKPILRLPESSKFHSDQFYDQTTVLTALNGDTLYWALGSDPKVFAFDLNTNQLAKTYDFEPSIYHTLDGQEKQVGYVNFMREADIGAIFPSDNFMCVYYHEGIDKETYQNHELNEPENYSRYPLHQKFKIKFLDFKKNTWSNEIAVSADVKYILNFDGPDQLIYGLRNDEFTQEEELEYLTIYKMRLKKRQY